MLAVYKQSNRAPVYCELESGITAAPGVNIGSFNGINIGGLGAGVYTAKLFCWYSPGSMVPVTLPAEVEIK